MARPSTRFTIDRIGVAMNERNWHADTPACSHCHRGLLPSNIEAIDTSDGEITLGFRNLPCLRCPDDHERRPTSADFGQTLEDALLGPQGFPTARFKGIFRKTALCPRCDHALSETRTLARFELALVLKQSGTQYEVEFETPIPGTATHSSLFWVDLSCPSLRCDACDTNLAMMPAADMRTALGRILDKL